MCTLCTLSLITCIISFCHQLSMLNSSSPNPLNMLMGSFLRRVFLPVYDVRPPCPLVSTLGFNRHFFNALPVFLWYHYPSSSSTFALCLNPTPYGSRYLYEFFPSLEFMYLCSIFLFGQMCLI